MNRPVVRSLILGRVAIGLLSIAVTVWGQKSSAAGPGQKGSPSSASGRGQGAAIGGDVSGSAESSFANTIAKRRQILKGKENDLDARVSYAGAVDKDAQDYLDSLEQLVESTRYKLDELRAKVRRNEISPSVLKQEKQRVTRLMKEIMKDQALLQKELTDLKLFRSKLLSKELDWAIDRFEMFAVRFKKNSDELAALNQRI